MIQCKVAAAQNQMTGPQHMLTAASGIFGMVLVVTVDCDDTETLWAVSKEPAEGIFQCGTLALVDFMVQQVDDVGVGSGFFFKVVQVLLLAAVVDQNDVGKAVLQKTFDDRMELFIGIQRRQNDRNFR